MHLYNDSGREITLLNKKGEKVILGKKKTIEVDDAYGQKLIGMRTFQGLQDADKITGDTGRKSNRQLMAENKRLLAELEKLKGGKKPAAKKTEKDQETGDAE